MAVLVIPGVSAYDTHDKKKEMESRLARIRTLEIPAAVLGIVRATEATEQVETIQAAMHAIALHRPTTLPLVVSTLSSAEPHLSMAAASAAASASPAQAELIERAAVVAAPTYAGSISSTLQAQGYGKKSDHRGNGGNGKKADPDHSWTPPGQRDTLPNGKPRPDPPRRPVDPPRPMHYNKPPKPDRPGKPEHPLPERPGNPHPGGKEVRPGPPGGHPVWDR